MSTDRGLEVTRAVREKISHEHGNDPRRLIDYYMKYQERFAERLRRHNDSRTAPGEPEEKVEAPEASER